MSSTSFRRMLFKTPMRDLVRFRITGRLDIDRLLVESNLSGSAADKVRNVVKRTRLWRLEKVDVAHELIAHFLDGQEADTPLDDLLDSFGDERQTAKLIRRAKKRQRPMIWHAFAWARLSVAAFIGIYILSALYLLTGSPSITTDYVAQLNHRSANVPPDKAAWPMYREALLELDLTREQEWDTPIPYYSDLSQEEKEGYRRDNAGMDSYGGMDMMGGGDDYYVAEYEPPFIANQWERLEKSLSPGEPGWSQTVVFLRDHADTLALIRRGASQQGLGFVLGFRDDYTRTDLIVFGIEPLEEQASAGHDSIRAPERSVIQVLLPHLGPMRTMARLLAADTARVAAEGDGETAYDNTIAILNLARHVDEQSFLINGLVRLSIQSKAYRSIQDVLIAHPELWTDEQLQHLAHRIAAIDNAHEDWFNGERVMFYDILQRIYTDDGHGGGRITKEGIANFTAITSGGNTNKTLTAGQSAAITAGLPVAAVLMAPRDEMRRVYDSLIDRMIVESQQPLWEYHVSDSIDYELDALNDTLVKQVRYMPISELMPSLSAMNRTIQTNAGRQEGVLIGISLILYQREHGDWPETLDDLAPRFLPTIPPDRLTGEPLRYRVTESGPVVYSVGVDADDDGGRPPVHPHSDLTQNNAAGPGRFTGDTSTDAENDGDWILWPEPED